MNITFLLGNGFDIGLGLRTRYEDFYKTYTKNKPDDSENIRKFKKALLEDDLYYSHEIINWSDFEKAFGQYSNVFDFFTKVDYLKCFEDFVINFNEYLETEEKRIEYTNLQLIEQTMFNAVTKYFHIRNKDKEYIQNLYTPISDGRVYNFISFNYTKTVDRCANILEKYLESDKARKVGKVLHIHGFIEENMIVGVNDKSQIKNVMLAEDGNICRELVKPQQNFDMRTNYEKQATEIIEKSDIICVYGMSIGETDKKWWECIGEWLKNNEKHALVILKYDKNFDKRFPFNHNKYVDNNISRFLKLSGGYSNNIRERVFVGMNYNVFSMNLIEEKNKNEMILK